MWQPKAKTQKKKKKKKNKEENGKTGIHSQMLSFVAKNGREFFGF
jgi:hypothetical protein